MKIFQLLLITVTSLTACTKKIETPVIKTPVAVTDTLKTSMTDTLTYLALGDSYTIGEAVPQTQSFPYQLASMLAPGYGVKAPTIIAVTGWTTDNLIAAINASGLIGKKYDFVTLLIGVNDQFQGLSQDNYRTNFAQLLQTAVTFAKGDTSRVFVLSIPDWGVTPFANGNEATIGPQIDQFNAINKEITTMAGVHYVDITPISRQAATDLTLVAPDGLHPSGKMYTEWMNLLTPLVKQRLGKK